MKINRYINGVLFLIVFSSGQLSSGENPIWIGAESDTSSLVLPHWESGSKVHLDDASLMKISNEDIASISVWPWGKEINLQLKLIPSAWKKLNAMAKKLKSVNKRFALIINGKIALLIPPEAFTRNEDIYNDNINLSVGPVPEKLLKELKKIKNIDWYIYCE